MQKGGGGGGGEINTKAAQDGRKQRLKEEEIGRYGLLEPPGEGIRGVWMDGSQQQGGGGAGSDTQGTVHGFGRDTP